MDHTDKYEILGKSHYALAIIFDILSLKNPDGCKVKIISNIDESKNDSKEFAFEAPGVDWVHVESGKYQPDPDAPKIFGSIGRSRRAIFNFFHENFDIGPDQYETLVHPSAIIGVGTTIGRGVHISPNVTIAPCCTVGDFCVVNRAVSIGHHTTLDDFACLNPGVTVAGICHLGVDVMVGAGATIIDQIRVGAGSIIGAGSVVTKSIDARVVAYGVPAKVVRKI